MSAWADARAQAGTPSRLSRLPGPAVPAQRAGTDPDGAGSAGTVPDRSSRLSHAGNRLSQHCASARRALAQRSTGIRPAPRERSMSARPAADQRSPSAAPARCPVRC